jgi:hypothetical protein
MAAPAHKGEGNGVDCTYCSLTYQPPETQDWNWMDKAQANRMPLIFLDQQSIRYIQALVKKLTKNHFIFRSHI